MASGQLFEFTTDYLDADGRPSLLGFVLQRGKISEFKLNDYQQQVLTELQSNIVKNWSNDYQEKVVFEGPDGVIEARKQISPAVLHDKISRELDSVLGEEFSSRLSQFAYQRYISENNLYEFLRLPHIVSQLDISEQQLAGIQKNQKELGEKLRSSNRAILTDAFRSLISKFDETRKSQILQKLEIKDLEKSAIPDWVLYAVLADAQPQRKFLLIKGPLPIREQEFDYLAFFRNEHAVSYLELVPQQKDAIRDMNESRKSTTRNFAESNEKLLKFCYQNNSSYCEILPGEKFILGEVL